MITSELTEMPSNSEQQSALLQQGATSTVECRWEDNRKVFVKRLRQELTSDERYREAFYKEFEIGKAFDCPRLVKYIRMEGDSIIEEFVDGLTLDAFIRENPDYYHNEARLRTMLLQLLEGLAYLHERQILHLDLKPTNIIITRLGNHVKIVDFGFSYSDSFVMSPGKTEGFAAPEQFCKGAELNVTTDLYAFGRIIKYIDTEIGLPKKYKAIAERCCMEKTEERYTSVDDVRNAIMHKEHRLHIIFVFFILLAIACSVISYNTRYRVPKEPFCYKGIYYRATSDSTLMVVEPKETSRELDLIIPERVTHNGHTYTVTSIDSNAYSKCKNLVALTLPESIDSIYYRAFDSCGNISNVYIPDNVTYLAQDALRDCDKLTAVRLPSNIDRLSRGLFSLCDGLEEIDVPDNVRVLEQDAFGCCRKLRIVHLHEGLEVIGRGAFWQCSSLSSLTIPSTVKEIGDYAFWGCSSMTDLYMKCVVPPRVTNIFNGLQLRIHVPKDAEQNYKEAVFWKSQKIIVE